MSRCPALRLGAFDADWARSAVTPGGEQTTLDLVWSAVDTALADLVKAPQPQAVLTEVRGTS